MDLVLVRHTRPEVEPGVCYGRLDLPLAPTWENDVAECLRRIPKVTAVISSPAARCRVLAEAVASRDRLAVEMDSRLLELDFGAWEGCRWDEIPRADIDRWAADTLRFAPGRGESLQHLCNRVMSVLRRFEATEVGPAVLVTHRGPLRVLIAGLGGRAPEAGLSVNIPFGAVMRMQSGAG